jgi:hypothetical protein
LYFWFPWVGYLDKTTCVKTCPTTIANGGIFSDVKEERDAEIALYYQNPITGSDPSEEYRLDCKTNSKV